MRPIKFRVWDSVNQMMMPVTKLMLGRLSWVHAYGDPAYGAVHPEDGALMQFTGLKDKNGKEIYKGDIIEYGTGLTKQKAIIEYQIHCYNAGFYPSESANASHYWEVIGNIHQPELIEEQDNG